MEKVSQKDIDWLLNLKLESSHEDSTRTKKVKRLSIKRSLAKFLFSILLVVGLGILPFFILIKTAVFLTISKDLNVWLSLLGGMFASTLLLGIYILFICRNVKNKKLIQQFGFSGGAILVGGFCIYGLLYLSSVHAKTEDVREVYRTLHPILRVAVATTTLAEKNLVITDIKRTKEDYISWGLSPAESSMHYQQSDGYVHAIDLRTIGHSELRNNVLEWTLTAKGFQIIRHIGTADHLHVALPKKK